MEKIKIYGETEKKVNYTINIHCPQNGAGLIMDFFNFFIFEINTRFSGGH